MTKSAPFSVLFLLGAHGFGAHCALAAAAPGPCLDVAVRKACDEVEKVNYQTRNTWIYKCDALSSTVDSGGFDLVLWGLGEAGESEWKATVTFGDLKSCATPRVTSVVSVS